MHTIEPFGLKPVRAGPTDLRLSSHAITSFAEALCLRSSFEERADFGQPILISLQKDRPNWLEAVEALIHSSARMVIAIHEDWLDAHFCDEHGYDDPVATIYELVSGNIVATEAMLHESRSGIPRLCAVDLTKAYVTFENGSGRWERLDLTFVRSAAAGIRRGAERWFWEHDALTTKDLVAVVREIETEERLGLRGLFPEVILNLGRR